jgi:hypothetical protein
MRHENDYVLRLIEQLGSLVRQVVERLRATDSGEPLDVAGQALGLALDMDPAVASELSPRSLASLLSLGSLDERALRLVHQALQIEATVLEARGDSSAAEFRRRQADAVRALLTPHTTLSV